MPFLRVTDEIQIHYQIDDFTNAWEHRPTLFLQHGNGRSGEFWYQWVPLLARDYRVVRVDMRGLGQSSSIQNPERDIKIQYCIEDLVRVIKEVSTGPILFCGESMGGILGLILASTYPELVMASVLSRFPPETNPELLKWYVREFSKSSPEVLIHYSDLVNSANATSYLSGIQCPTLAVMPSNGPITDPEQLRLLKEKIPQLQTQLIPSDYHMIHLTHAEECVKHIRNFFETIKA